jgi:SAM-dependent methyltransferase
VASSSLQEALKSHLAEWGLKRFTSDADYFAWQREKLSTADLNQLNTQIERRRGGDRLHEIAFYDLSAQPHILPVLYSQRYEYYNEIGSRVVSRIEQAKTILDFGCGVGILTTFYARQFPDRKYIGVDRSPASIAMAQQQAQKLGLTNVRFECVDVESEALSGSYDLIIATHALVQAEQDPGIPSQNWQTFEHTREAHQQAEFERRTGIGVLLDRLSAALSPVGRVIAFEKTRQLARRIPLQRAFSARGLYLLEEPVPIRYQLVEEVADDGPFYVLQKTGKDNLDWDESPEPDEGPPLDRARLKAMSADPDTPLYENHWPSAQRAWEQLDDRKVIKETTRQEPDGRQMHVELGTAEGYVYLYCANTFDQRQLVIVEPSRAAMLETYYQEIVGGNV